MPRYATTLFVLMSTGIAAAQSVTATFATATPVATVAYSSVLGQPPVQQVVPASTPGPQFLSSPSGNTEARSTWFEYSFATETQVAWQQFAHVLEGGPSFAVATGQILVDLAATSATPVTIELSRVLTAGAGTVVPACSIDVGDDGAIEMTVGTTAVVSISSITLDVQPLRIRMRSHVSQTGQGMVDLELRMRVFPNNSLAISPVGLGCAGAGLLVAVPAFAGTGVQFTSMLFDPVVLVLGIDVQPLTAPLFPAACPLLPRPDALVPVFAGQPFTLALPAAVRPVTLWAQGVTVLPGQLLPTRGFWLHAW
ncbi:MAG TPA: hypothetical protein VF384_13970 [Planctomycetota bacterium]